MRKIRVARRKRPSPPQRDVPSSTPSGLYLPDAETLVKLIAMRGASDEEIELVYALSPGTIKKWKEHYPGLKAAIENGRTLAEGQVLFSMFKTACGYEYTEEQAVGGRSPTVLPVKRHMPAQFLAQKHWMASRNREQWPAADKLMLAGTGKDGAIRIEGRNEVIDAILALIASKPDPEKSKTLAEQKAGESIVPAGEESE
jgi:hypothetical protein